MIWTKRIAVIGALLASFSQFSGGVTPLFGPAVKYRTGSGTGPAAIVTGDLNKDGIIDLVTANPSGNNVSVLLGGSDGSFSLPTQFPAGSVPNDLILGDFNRDGKLDLAVTDGSPDYAVSILQGNGDGTFQQPVSYAAGKSTNSLAAGDFNGDGFADLAVCNPYNGGKVLVLLGRGDGTFQNAIGYPAGGGPFSVEIGDLNSDGNSDLVVVNYLSNSVSVLLGNGDGTFQTPASYPVGQAPRSVAVADLNGDGAADIAVADSQSGKVSVLFNNGDGTMGLARTFPVANASPYSVVAGDLNGDGTIDLAVSNQDAAVNVLLGDGKGNFAERDFRVTFFPTGISASDINDDGKPDLVVATRDDRVDTLLNNGAFPSAKLSAKQLAFAEQVVGTSSAPQKVTLTNDGTLPLAIASIVGSQNFLTSSTCSTQVFMDATCNISVKFKPQKKGLITGSVAITDNAFDSPQIISLTGSATVVSLSATSLDFGSIPVGQTSPPQTVTLTNVSQNPLNIVSIVLEGSMFAQTNDCGFQLAGNATCTITVTFAPTAHGPASAVLRISDNGGGSPQKVSLTGSGT